MRNINYITVVERLRPGGVLLIWDFLPHGPLDPHQHQHHHGHGHGSDKAEKDEEQATREIFRSVMHHGFSEARMKEIFTGAGAGAEFRLEVIGRGFVIGGHGHGHEHEDTKGNLEEKREGERKDDVRTGAGTGEDKGEGKVNKEALRRQVFFARGTKGGVED